MILLIHLDGLDPPIGTASVPAGHGRTSGAVVSFVGWLGFLRVLSDLCRDGTDGDAAT